MSCGTTVMFFLKCNNMYALVLTRTRLGLDVDQWGLDSDMTRMSSGLDSDSTRIFFL